MSRDTFSQSVKQLEQWQREYKTAQSRLAGSIKVHKASIRVSVPLGGHVNVWMNANPDTVLASCLLTDIAGDDLIGVYIRPVYQTSNGGRCGFAIWNYLGRALNNINVQIQANQEVTLSAN